MKNEVSTIDNSGVVNIQVARASRLQAGTGPGLDSRPEMIRGNDIQLDLCVLRRDKFKVRYFKTYFYQSETTSKIYLDPSSVFITMDIIKRTY